MTAELMRRLLDCFAGADPAHIVAEDYVDHQGETTSGLTGFSAMVSELRRAFPDLHLEVEDVIIEDDHAVARLRWHGTFTGSFWGKPPTGDRFEAESIEIVRFANDRAVEHWGISRGWP